MDSEDLKKKSLGNFITIAGDLNPLFRKILGILLIDSSGVLLVLCKT
jgi:hypothetical protein